MDPKEKEELKKEIVQELFVAIIESDQKKSKWRWGLLALSIAILIGLVIIGTASFVLDAQTIKMINALNI